MSDSYEVRGVTMFLDSGNVYLDIPRDNRTVEYSSTSSTDVYDKEHVAALIEQLTEIYQQMPDDEESEETV